MKSLIKRVVPAAAWQQLRNLKHGAARSLRGLFESAGLSVARTRDYYSPLPSERQLRRKQSRWARPSPLSGLQCDLASMKERFDRLVKDHYAEFSTLPSHADLCRAGYGPGYPHVDAFTLYAMIRQMRPGRYLEVGSGLSTYYTHLARERNRDQGRDLHILCVEPYPYAKLNDIQPVELVATEVQDVPLSRFKQLAAGDVLFIDSSHSVRIDGDVPYLFLEVLPVLAPGVYVHIHDIPFPFNVPYPPEYWTLVDDPQSPHWPMFWTEAMLVQAFLAFNPAFEIVLSTPMIRHHDEAFLRSRLPIYRTTAQEPNTFSSLWIRRVT